MLVSWSLSRIWLALRRYHRKRKVNSNNSSSVTRPTNTRQRQQTHQRVHLAYLAVLNNNNNHNRLSDPHRAHPQPQRHTRVIPSHTIINSINGPVLRLVPSPGPRLLKCITAHHRHRLRQLKDLHLRTRLLIRRIRRVIAAVLRLVCVRIICKVGRVE